MAEAAKLTPAEEQKEMKRANWADEDDDGDDDDGVEIGGSTVAKVGQTQAAQAEPEKAEEPAQPKVTVPPKPRTVVRERNIYGDFIITKVNVKEREIIEPVKDSDEEEESSEEESEEETPAAQEPVEEEKKGKKHFCSQEAR